MKKATVSGTGTTVFSTPVKLWPMDNVTVYLRKTAGAGSANITVQGAMGSVAPASEDEWVDLGTDTGFTATKNTKSNGSPIDWFTQLRIKAVITGTATFEALFAGDRF